MKETIFPKHVVAIDQPNVGSTLGKLEFEYFMFEHHEKSHLHESLHTPLSCDLPPDLGGCENDVATIYYLEQNMMKSIFYDYALALDNPLFAKLGHTSTHEVLSCDLTPDLDAHEYDYIKHMISVQTFVAACSFVLQDFSCDDSPLNNDAPYILEPLPIDPEPPPKMGCQQTNPVLDKLIFLICDENFCYKSLKRFRHKVVSFLHLHLLF
ncbi:hypothetical protein QN277_009615 [Acacia crassicarpa]|uniref:Uncharacterized protein n=1 Tax=Acacia crassicarpa TaxID=499986 RepID=A0AAE1IRE1_9FABA|nr:hypothetical protein QN277_009615 [Acacia crassicarpa]